MYWFSGAPKLEGPDNAEEVTRFIDRFITTRSTSSPFGRRQFSDRLLNAYNRNILGLHRENIDIQFILDAYACCSYIINYINKSKRGSRSNDRNKPQKCFRQKKIAAYREQVY